MLAFESYTSIFQAETFPPAQEGARHALRHRRRGNAGSIDLYYEDHGLGPPAVLIAVSAASAVACSATWETDFRAGVRKIDVPVLAVQDDADQAVPFEKTGKRVLAYVSDVQLVTVSGGPHAILWTYAEQVNTALLPFIGGPAAAPAR